MLLGAKLGGQVGLSGGRVQVGLFCSAMLLLLHSEMLSLSRTKILSGSLRAGVKVRLSYGHVGGTFGPISATVLKAIWDHFGPSYFGMLKNNPKLHLQNALIHGPRGVTEEIQKNQSKNKISSKTLTVAGRPKRNKQTSKNMSPKS